MKYLNLTASATFAVFVGLCSATGYPADSAEPTNLVFILTDNQGAWTLGCYGNPDIRTPSIDRLAQEGIRFDRAFASNPVCSPTRATYLTGLIPSQHGIHSFLGGEKPDAQMGLEAACQIAEFDSLPTILNRHGYVCGLSGKWHLGDSLTPQLGFTSWITMPRGSTAEFYDAPVIEDGKVRTEPGYLTDLWTERGVQFLKENQSRPFFLYLAYNGPYNLGPLLTRRACNRHADSYDTQWLPSFPRDAMHPWQFNNKDYLNNIISIRRVAAETSGVDDGVGRILQTLDELGLAENTLVVYAADQGWMGGQNGLWGMGDHTRPVGAHELMMRVPLIFRHRGALVGGRVSNRFVSNYDFLPSILDYLKIADRPASSPGRSYAHLLRGEEPIAWDDVVYYEMEGTRAIRTADWKLVKRHPDGPHELYDMRTDGQERFNLFGQPAHADKREELDERLKQFFAQNADPKYDVWRDGRSKAGRLP
ncbi:MAG: sulfatase-like hydrolase/transferase [Planctomycetaceae bacterium]|nr:sulfatase-like hydrolase/transferase [Planctomycetaceae bacterium]